MATKALENRKSRTERMKQEGGFARFRGSNVASALGYAIPRDAAVRDQSAAQCCARQMQPLLGGRAHAGLACANGCRIL